MPSDGASDVVRRVMAAMPKPMWQRTSATAPGTRTSPARKCTKTSAAHREDPLLVRTARGEAVERTPVWLMRQAGRYMAEFRAYSDKYPFRMRSETPEIAVELSLQPWRAFGTDAVIFFSDILTPLPSVGVEFDVIKGKGPRIERPLRSMEDVMQNVVDMGDPNEKLPFVRTILETLRHEIDESTALVGFVGAPWTLAAYAWEGKADRHLLHTKTAMTRQPEAVHLLLDKLTDMLAKYCVYQIDSGAQVMQIFDSWAHHLSPEQFQVLSLPYVERIVQHIHEQRPGVPVIFHANGGVGKLKALQGCTADVIGLDWNTDIAEARQVLGPGRVLQGNVDPMLLFAPHETIQEAVHDCIHRAQPGPHILNVGHGVVQGTPEEAVKYFVQVAKESGPQQGYVAPADRDLLTAQ